MRTGSIGNDSFAGRQRRRQVTQDQMTVACDDICRFVILGVARICGRPILGRAGRVKLVKRDCEKARTVLFRQIFDFGKRRQGKI